MPKGIPKYRGPKRILDLCSGSGAWSQPYVDAGYHVQRIDILNGLDVRVFRMPLLPVWGVLAAPPCTAFAHAGNRWTRFGYELREGLAVVDACLRVIRAVQPQWWALENPRGRLREYIGPPVYRFDPCDFGDPYTKDTYLWGDFNPPVKSNPVEPTLGSYMHDRAPKEARAITPPGFARAFFEANP